MNRYFYFFFLTIVSLCVYSSLFAQTSADEIPGIPWTGSPGITETVREIIIRQNLQPVKPFSGLKDKKEEPTLRPYPKQNPVAPAAESWPAIDKTRTSNEKQTFLNPQSVGTNFLAIQASESPYVPPDCMGDVGPTQIVGHTNGRIKVFNKDGSAGAFNVTDEVFWTSVRNGQGVSDPHVRYDRISKRWFLVIINTASSNNRILIAVSSDSIITSTSSFTFYQFSHNAVGTSPNSDTNGFADYPTLGVDANALYIGVNVFNSAGTSVVGTTGFVVRKSALLTGSLVVTAFRQLTNGSTTGPWTPQGVDNDDATATEGYFIGVDFLVFSQLDVIRVSNPGGTPSISSSLTITVPTTIYPENQVHSGMIGTRTLDGLDDRLFAAQLKKNKLTGIASLWTAHAISVNSSGVATAGGRNGSRWYEIRNLTTTPTLFQSGTLYDPAASNPRGFWIPSVAMSGQGHMALGSSYASAVDFAGVSVAGRLYSDAAGTTQSATLAQVSSTAYNAETSGPQRWGDYSQTVVDPNDDMTMWTFQEYCNATNSWGMRVTQLRAPLPVAPSSASPPSVAAGTSNVNVTITGTSSGGTGFFDPGAGYTNRISAAVNGGGVTVNNVTFTSPTSVTLNISISAGATTSARTVTITNPDGQIATSATGILTISPSSCPTITLSPSSLSSGSVGSSYNQSITASGGTAPYTYAVTSGSLPSGVSLSGGGLLSGTPAINGTFNFTVTATDDSSCTGNRAYSLTITGCPAITLAPTSLPGGNVGTAYNQTITSSGGTSPYTHAVTSGSLPSGLSLSSGGAITGTPTTQGNYSFTVTATDATSCTGNRAYSVTICPAITLSPSTLPNGTAGISYNQTITASGGTAPYTYAVTSGSLPSGLSLSSGGVLSGTPASSGSSSFTVTATDAASCTGNQAYSLTINSGANTIILTTLGSAYTQDFNTLANSGTSSTLPTGWLFSESGSNQNTTYAADNGSANSGNTYSYGTTSASDRAFGGLQSGSLNPIIGANFLNNTGATITSLAISYTGEEWRLGTRNRFDSLFFQLSFDATSLTTGAWTPYTQLYFRTPDTSGAAGARDGNTSTYRTAVSSTLTGLSITTGSTFYIRWVDANPTGSDDGLSVDDFSLTPNGSASPTNPSVAGAATPSSVIVGNTSLLTATITPGTNPASSGITVAGDLTNIGGSATQTFFDNATNGDQIPGDNVFSYQATVPLLATPGLKILPLTVNDAELRSGSGSINLTVLACPTITISPTTLPDAVLNAVYSQQVTATGGSTPYTYSVITGSLPAGITLSASGLLSGTPTSLGVSNFTVQATDSTNCTGTKAYTLQVVCPVITVSPATLPNGTIGVAYSQTNSASGGTGPYTFNVTTGTLPDGLSLSSGGSLTGTPTTPGTFNFTVTATDTNNCTGNKAYAIQINCTAISVTPASLPAGIKGTAYIDTVKASGGTQPYTYSVTSGVTPSGVTLASNGSISGTPDSLGTFNFTVTVTDSIGCTASKSYSINVECPVITLLPVSLSIGTVGNAYAETVAANGGEAPYAYSVTLGILPNGVTLTSTGNLSGTPSVADTFDVTITATDMDGCTGNQNYSIIIEQGSLMFVEVPLTSRWNIISNPLAVPNDSVSVLFPGGVSSAYAYISGSGYQTSARLLNGAGYWMKFGADHTQSLLGSVIVAESIAVEDGWNLVGSLSTSIPVSSISALGSSIASPFFKYENGYQVSDTIKPGKGYWVNVSGSGTLVLSSNAIPAVAGHSNGFEFLHDGYDNILIEDASGNSQILYIGNEEHKPVHAAFTLPPIPPSGVFDVRFASGTFAEFTEAGVRKEYPVRISSANFPLSIRWNIQSEGLNVRLKLNGTMTPAAGEGNIVLERIISEPVLIVSTLSAERPKEFALYQNYPNPFNPSTVIRYALAEEGRIRIKIFDLLGREVTTLVDEFQQAGYGETEWNAANVPGGIYFYRMQVNGYTFTKKLLLLK